MPAYAFEGIIPVVDETTYVHPTASLIGDVIVGPRCFIGPGASLRGDFGRIIVEGDSSIQDNCVMHANDVNDCVIGRGATVGHSAILHGCKIGENVLVGINSVVLDEAQIGEECLIGANSLVKSDMIAGPCNLIDGNPARIIRSLEGDEIRWRNDGDGAYQRLADRARAGLVERQPLGAPEKDRRRNTGDEQPIRLRNHTNKNGIL